MSETFKLLITYSFPLKTYIQKPYSQIGLTTSKGIYNYRLNQTWRIVENVFEIISNHFRVFMTPIGLASDKVEKIVMACCTLHNFLRRHLEASSVYTPPPPAALILKIQKPMSTFPENGDNNNHIDCDHWIDREAIDTLIPQKKLETTYGTF